MVSTEITHPKVSADTLMSLWLTHTLPSTITQVKPPLGLGLKWDGRVGHTPGGGGALRCQLRPTLLR